MSHIHQSTNRGVTLLGRTSTTNLNDNNSMQQPSSGSTILDTLKKKMSQLKEELETSKDEVERNRQLLDEEKRRREVVRV
jgi:hypothetical protein